MPNATSHIMVMVKNEFETQKQIINNEIPPNVIRIETQDNSEEFIEIILPEEEQDLWDKTLDAIIKLRKKSKSKGSAIEINKKDEEQIKIHNKAGEDGD